MVGVTRCAVTDFFYLTEASNETRQTPNASLQSSVQYRKGVLGFVPRPDAYDVPGSPRANTAPTNDDIASSGETSLDSDSDLARAKTRTTLSSRPSCSRPTLVASLLPGPSSLALVIQPFTHI